MLTTFDQVRDWIIDNGFKRWILYKDGLRQEMIVDSAGFPSTDMNTRLATTEKYLRYAGGHAYAVGGSNATKSEMNVCAEIQLADVQPLNSTQGTAGIGMMDRQTIGELRRTIEEGLEAKWEKKMYEKEKKEFEEAKRQFEEDRNGVIGAVVGYLAPYIPVLNQIAGMRKVAGVDVAEPLHAQPIIPEAPEQDPEDPQEQPQEEQNPFTDEEADELFALMAEFKRVEPDYLPMIRKVVDMAKANDATYQMAKKFLV